MSYFIFIKNSDNIEGSIYRIAENENDLNNLNIIKSDYKIIEDSITNFNLVKLRNKRIVKYNENLITYAEDNYSFLNKEHLKIFLDDYQKPMNAFLNNNPNHPLYNLWNNYLTQIKNLNLDNITYPLNKSLEQYFNDLGQPSLNILQLP
jgi:hypothetical protein